VPEGTASLALVVDDPDAPGGTFSHWRARGIAPAAGGLGEGEAPPSEGRNDLGSVGWRGPCPPPGQGPYRYFFRLHALDAELELPAGAAKAEVDRALADRALAVAELVGIYERSQSGASSDALALLGLAPAITQRLIAECVRRPATTAWTSPQTTG
jgi:Raf kinase inhibitor-like YbhB/YbcL family protein